MNKNTETKSPLKLCLLQVVFSPVLNMGNYIPGIQDQLRKNGFPLFETNKTFTINQSNGQKELNQNGWIFKTLDSEELFIVYQDAVFFQVADYSGFDAFVEKFRKLINIFFAAIGFSPNGALMRIGLRYVNCFRGPEWKERLNESYCGIVLPDLVLHKEAKPLFSSLIQTASDLGKKGVGNLVVKVYQNDRGVEIPLDLISCSEAESSGKKLITFLDIDHFVQFARPAEMTLDGLFEFVGKLHDVSLVVFNSAIRKPVK